MCYSDKRDSNHRIRCGKRHYRKGYTASGIVSGKQIASEMQNHLYKSRFEEMSAIEIAQEMNISRRTVEGHILLGRKQVRQYISRHI